MGADARLSGNLDVAVAVSFVGYQGYVGNGGSLTASKPAGTVTGDVIVVVLTSSGWFNGAVPVAPAGWTMHSEVGANGGDGTRVWFYWRLVGAADTTYVWTVMPHDYSYASASYRGGASVTFGTVANLTGVAPAVTAGATGGKFVYLIGMDISGGGSMFTSVPAGWVIRGETDRVWPASGIADRTAAATAAESSGAVSVDSLNEPRTSCVAAVVAATVPPTPASSGAVAYIYENVGVEALPSSKESVGYIYENVGVEAVLSSQESVVYIYENVDATASIFPHLWKVWPTYGEAGDLIEVWAHGLAGSEVKFYLHAQSGWDEPEVIDAEFEMIQATPATLIAATANAYNAARSIPAGEFEPNVEHWKAVITVPDSATSGTRKIRVQVTLA